MEQILGALVVGVVVVLALFVKALRKTIGLLLIILGTLACLTFFGVVIGIPMIIVGGILLFM